MSGGHFDYRNYCLNEIADSIELHIHQCRTGFVNEYGSKFSAPAEVLAKMEEVVNRTRQLERDLHRVDYYISGDYGEDEILKIGSPCQA